MSEDTIRVLKTALATITACQFAAEGGTDITRWGCCPECYGADWQGHRDGCQITKNIQDIDAHLSELEATSATGWRPIAEYDPEKHGRYVDVWHTEHERLAKADFNNGHWWHRFFRLDEDNITHFMPLPPPPTGEKE